MDRYRKGTSTFFTRLAYGIGVKQRPAIVLQGPPAPQTGLIFGLPDELILSILSHISPDSRLTSHHARFRIQYGMMISDHHWQRVQFLRPLSVTCRAMRLRFLPWVQERLEVCLYDRTTGRDFAKIFAATVRVSRADEFLATSVKFLTVLFPWEASAVPLFVKCLKSLPNLHTLEIGSIDSAATPFRNAFKGVTLPQIKTLILPLIAHPLLQHCCNVEDVVCVVWRKPIPSEEFLVSLASNQDSKVKQLAIPLVLWDNPSRFATACPSLTELTVICPHPHYCKPTETGGLLGPVGSARSLISELTIACKALPDFCTFQIVYLHRVTPNAIYASLVHGDTRPSTEQQKLENQVLVEEVNGMKDWAMDCLRRPEAECLEGEGRKKIMVRVIELSSETLSHLGVYSRLGSVKVEGCEVLCFDSEDP